MKISQEGLALIKKFEGCPTDEKGNVVSYRCAANVPTIGFGSTKYKGQPVEDGMKISMQEAEDLLIHEMDEYEGYVNHMVKTDLSKMNLMHLLRGYSIWVLQTFLVVPYFKK